MKWPVEGRHLLAAVALAGSAACGEEQLASGGAAALAPGENPAPGAAVPVPSAPAVCAESAKVQPRLYRLSTSQYGNALRDLLRLPASPTLIGDTEATLAFYPREDAPVQNSVAEGFSRASREVLETLDVAALANCNATSTAPDATATACAQTFLEGFASRAFRRPLDDADRDALFRGPESPFMVGNATGVASGLRLALEAVLNAPSFVYRRELGGSGGRLNSYETAEQLAFLLRDSIPDAGLWNAARMGLLETNEQIGAEVDRLLLDPLVRANVTRIVGAWFGAERVLQVSKDPTVFPGFNDKNLQAALFESNRRFIENVLWNGGGDLAGLLHSSQVFLNADLAELYGLPFAGANPSAFQAYDMPDQRAGILTQPAVMAAFASSLETSIVKRGLFVVRRAMCLPEPPAPPPAIFALAVAQSGDFSRTEKQKADYRADPANPCAGCHALIDPYGVSFENYDAVGRFRTSILNGDVVDPSSIMQEDIVLPEAERALDEDFTEVVDGALDFVDLMGKTDQFAFCGSKQLLSYALGRAVDDSCVEEDLEQGVIHRDMTIGEIIRNVVLDDLTRRRDAAGGM